MVRGLFCVELLQRSGQKRNFTPGTVHHVTLDMAATLYGPVHVLDVTHVTEGPVD